MCIRQFPSNLFYVGLSSLYLKLAKNAWKHHTLQNSVNKFPQIRFMGIFNMSCVIPFKWHQKSFDNNFFRVQHFSYPPRWPVITSTLYFVVRGSILGPGMLYRCKHLTSNNREYGFLVGCGSSVVGAKLGQVRLHCMCLSDETLYNMLVPSIRCLCKRQRK